MKNFLPIFILFAAMGFLFLVMLTAPGCASSNQNIRANRTEGELKLCVQECMLKNPGHLQDRGDVMGVCELSCR